MKARAKESRGQGTADADVTMVLRGDNGRTAATVTTEVALTGKAATMGHGVLQDVAGRLVQTFARNLATMLSGGAAPEAAAAAAAAGPPARPGLEETPQESATASAKPEPPPPSRAGSGPEAAAPPPPPSPPPPSEDALDLGSLGGAVLADRLRQPRTLALVLVALVSYVLGRRSARR
jgi:hypothetical protein